MTYAGQKVDLRVAVCNDTIKHNLVQVGGLKLQHLVDTIAIDLVSCIPDLLASSICATETSLDQLLTEAIQQVKCLQMGASRDLDQLGKAIADLCGGKSSQESEVEECVGWCVVCAQTVLVVAVVDSDLDGYGSIDQANDCCGNADEWRVAAVGSACEAGLC